MNSEKEESRLFFTVMSSLTAGFLLWWIQSRFERTFSLSTFINPNAVASLASQLPEDEDAFILSAWQVASDLPYIAKDTEFKIVDSSIKCEKCYLPAEVLKLGAGNCVSKIVLLTSLLRNRLPSSRVYMVVGNLNMDGVGGHSWSVVERNGTWYLLESTSPPRGWFETLSLPSYEPLVYFNDAGKSCLDDNICIKIGAECQRCLQEQDYSLSKALY